MDQTITFWIIISLAVVTYLPRMLPLQLLSGRRLHPLIAAWLKLVPAAVLPAILLPMLLVPANGNGTVHLGFNNLFLWTALFCFPVAYRFQSLSLPVILGMVFVATARYLGWG